MRKLIVAGSTVVMMAAMGMTAFAANTVSAPSAGTCSYSDCRDDHYGNDCGEIHRRGCGHSSEGRRGHHGGCR